MKMMPVYIMMSLLSATPSSAFATKSCQMAQQNTICQTKDIKIYVGPQSVEPGEDIFIAVETLAESKISSSATSVVIIDEVSGQRHEAKVKGGLAYIELKAPRNSGRLTFRAETNGVSSKTAEVLVHAGPAANIELFAEKNKGQIFITSSIISDKFGNFVDDGVTTSIDLLSANKVYASFQATINAGRIGLHLPCTDISRPKSRVRARIGLVSHELDIPVYICGGKI